MGKSLEPLQKELKELEENRQAYKHAMGIIGYDAVTGAPVGGAERRGRRPATCSMPCRIRRTGWTRSPAGR